MKKVISVNSPTEVIVAKLNETVHAKVEIKDKMGLTNYYFGGDKIVQNVFLWESARHVNNFFKIKGEIVDRDNEHSEIHIKVINRPSYYVIYVLAIWFLLIAILSGEIFLGIFALVFVLFSWMTKHKYFSDIIADINNIVEAREK